MDNLLEVDKYSCYKIVLLRLLSIVKKNCKKVEKMISEWIFWIEYELEHPTQIKLLSL